MTTEVSSKTKSLVVRMADKYGVDESKFYTALKATAFKQRDGSAPSDEQMLALMVVSEQYGLNPFINEIYAFPDKQNKGIIPVVGVDGWVRIINQHSHFDGLEFEYSDDMIQMEGAKSKCHKWIETVIYRTDRSRPIRVREYLDEVYKPPYEGNGQYGPYTLDGPWQTHPKRQLRHKSLVQCARVAFGFSGIYDQDEAERIREVDGEVVGNVPTVAVPSQSQVMQIDHKKVDPLLAKLKEMTLQQQAWSAAEQYVQERLSGADLNYALEHIASWKTQHVDSEKTIDPVSDDALSATEKESYESVQQTEPELMAEGEDHYFPDA